MVGIRFFGCSSSRRGSGLYPVQWRSARGSVAATEMFGSPETLGKSLFTDFVLPFEIASVLLLVAIVGAVVLAKREP